MLHAQAPAVTVENKRIKYIDWENKVLEMHRYLCVRKFKINFDLLESRASNITNWIYAAMSQRVE